MWGCGVWGTGAWAGGVWCAVVRPPLHVLHVRITTKKPKVKFSPLGIHFCRLALWRQILINILNIDCRFAGPALHCPALNPEHWH